MRIAILADCHLGFGKGTERYQDAFLAFEEAFKKLRDVDAVLIAGDLFDLRTPDHEMMARTMEIMLPLILAEKSMKKIEGIGRDLPGHFQKGIPIIAISGTHERRSKGLMNPIQALEKAGFLIWLHCNGVVLEKDGERIAIQGMSTVPEGWAESVMQEWNPKPVENCFNILVFHQTPLGLFPGVAGLDLRKLPEGFDLYVCGHIHQAEEKQVDGKRIFIPGSLISTQIDDQNQKGFWILESGKLEFIRLEKQRPIFSVKTEEELEKVLEREYELKPIIRVSVEGKEKEIRAKYGEKAILVFEKTQKPEVQAVSPEVQRLSVQELGSKILKESLEKAGLQPEIWEQVFELLLEQKPEEVLKLLRKE